MFHNASENEHPWLYQRFKISTNSEPITALKIFQYMYIWQYSNILRCILHNTVHNVLHVQYMQYSSVPNVQYINMQYSNVL